MKPKSIFDIEYTVLSAVNFVRDYVELVFDDDMIVRALSDPVVHIGEKCLAFPEQGSRDALCAFIGDRCRSVKLVEGKHLRMSFGESAEVVVPLMGLSPHGEDLDFVDLETQIVSVW